MPELPEVEAVAQKLDVLLAGKRVNRLELRSVAALKTFDPRPEAIAGAPVRGVHRAGKFLVFELDGYFLVVHFARAGWLRWHDSVTAKAASPGAMKGPLAARLHFEGGATIDFTEQGTQKRLAIYLVRDLKDVPGIVRLGPDVLDANFTAQEFSRLLKSQSSNVKKALADQALIAGIGNAYSDEILHAAGVSPFAKTQSLDAKILARLYDVTRQVLSDALTRAEIVDIRDMKGDKKENLQVHGRTGEPCPVCGDTIRQVSFATRSFQYCPQCQTGGKIYADRRMSRLIK